MRMVYIHTSSVSLCCGFGLDFGAGFGLDYFLALGLMGNLQMAISLSVTGLVGFNGSNQLSLTKRSKSVFFIVL